MDADFALAYWGETLSYNHPLQQIRNLDSPRQALARFGPNPAARLARAKTPREKALIEAVDLLFGEGEESARR
jgi:hypothetical protein